MNTHTNRTYGTFWSRMLAHQIDLIVLLPLFYMIQFWLPEETFILCLFMTLLYDGILTIGPWQGTVGKHLMGLLVVDRSGERIKPLQGALRALFLPVTAVTVGFGYFMMHAHPQRRSVSDWIARTRVIVK